MHLEVGDEPPAHRLRQWKELLHEHFLNVECSAEADTLRSSIIGRALTEGSLSRSSLSPQVVSRTPALIKRHEDETAIVALVTRGTFLVEQGNDSSVLRPGELCVLDSARPFEATFASTVNHCIMHVPKSALTRRLNAREDLAFGTFRADAPVQKLAAAFLHGMTGQLDDIHPGTLDRLLDQSLDLLALMIGESRRGAIEPSTHRSAMLLRIKTFIDAHLKDADLSIERTASALGISSRYINALLTEEETSFGRYLRARRLEGARREIMDPRLANRHVTEVAYDWGFRNASHFGRVYKDRFGMAPRDAKMVGAAH